MLSVFSSDPTLMNRLLQSVSCTRLNSNQVAEYLLRPTSDSGASGGMHTQPGSSQQASEGTSTSTPGSNPPSGILYSSNLPRFSRETTSTSRPFSVSSRPAFERTSQDYSSPSQSHLGSSSSNLPSISNPTTVSTSTAESSSSYDRAYSTSTSHPPPVSMPSTVSNSSEPLTQRGQMDVSLSPHGSHLAPERSGPVPNLSNEPIVGNRHLNNEGASGSDTTNSMSLVAPSYTSDIGPSSENIAVPPRNTTGSQETREGSSNTGSNQQDTTGGVFAIFRARDGGSWNLDTSEVESDTDFANTSAESQGGEVSDSMSFGRIPQNSDLESMTSASSDFGNVLLRTRTFTSELRPNMTSTHETVTISNQENNSEGSTTEGNTGIQRRDEAVRINAADESITGMGTVFNVGSSTPRVNPSSDSNNASNLSTTATDGNGTAIATATARTFRHVHTAVVVAEGSNGGPQLALRTAINRAIAGAFAGSGEGAVASNIINTTHRLQWWDFSKLRMPDLKQSE